MTKSGLAMLCIVSALAIAGIALSSHAPGTGAAATYTQFSDIRSFHLDPKINCQYDDEFGTMQWTVENTLDTPIILDHAALYDAGKTTYAVMVINGREVNPELLCSSTVINPGQHIDCARWFDPNELKSDIYRTFHKYDWVSTYDGEEVLDVLRMRLLYKGSKYRTSQRFKCTKIE